MQPMVQVAEAILKNIGPTVVLIATPVLAWLVVATRRLLDKHKPSPSVRHKATASQPRSPNATRRHSVQAQGTSSPGVLRANSRGDLGRKWQAPGA